jgi:hypothetical protein
MENNSSYLTTIDTSGYTGLGYIDLTSSPNIPPIGGHYYAINWTLNEVKSLFPSTVYINFVDSNGFTYTPDLINISNGTLVLPDGIDNGIVQPSNWSTTSANDFVLIEWNNTGSLYLNLYQAIGQGGAVTNYDIENFRLSLTMTRIGPAIGAPIPVIPS